MHEFSEELMKANIGEVHFDHPMADYTTWKIGGPADIFVIPAGKAELSKLMRILHKHQVPWMQIGRGSNMLISDKGIRGVVIKLGPSFEHLDFSGDRVIAGGAYSFIKLSVMAGKQGLTGLEFAGGIPGSVGGAVFMNAGALGSDVSRILQSAEVVLDTGELVQLSSEEFKFSYRYSLLHDQPGIVTEASFRLQPGDRKEIAASMASNKDRRLRTQPLQMASCGSVFRNPPGHFAAKLIEEAGLKGTRIGDAEVSSQHANFIVNTGQATARDVIALIETIRDKVKAMHGIALETEVLMVGER